MRSQSKQRLGSVCRSRAEQLLSPTCDQGPNGRADLAHDLHSGRGRRQQSWAKISRLVSARKGSPSLP